MVKNIVFDLGGVIITIDMAQAVRRFEELGLADAAQRLDPYTQQGIFGDVESGRIGPEDFRRELSRMVGRELTHEQCLYGWMGYRKELPARNLQALRELRRKGYRLILLSNTNPYMMEWAGSPAFDGEGHGIESYFDAMYCSYREQLMKPDIRLFQRLLEQEKIKAEETLFVDDGPRNVEAAARLGLHTFCPQNGEDWTQRIFDFL